MAQDFANGQRHKRAPRSVPRSVPRSAPRTEPRRALHRNRTAFHWGSFGAGVALGIAFTLAGALLPQWWGSRAATAPTTQPPDGEPAPITRFEFFDRLPNARVASPSAAEPAVAPAAVEGPREFLLQAGSFTNKDDAERLRATLSQSGWSTDTATVTLSSGAIRHRVIVGPFASSEDAQRAISALRKQDVDALVLARKPLAP